MNFDAIRRSVRAKRHDRAAGDAPNMGRVARMPGTGLPKGSRRKRKKSESGRSGRLLRFRQQVITIWSLLLSGVALLVLGLTVWLWVVPQMSSRRETAGRLPGQAAGMARVAPKFPSPSEEDAMATVKRGLALRNPGKITEYFRPGGATAEEIVDFLGGLEAREGAIDHYEWLSSVDANGLSIDGVVVFFKGKEKDKPRNRLALLTPDEAGKWKIDFEAFARTVTPPWTELLDQHAEVAQVRVYAVRDNYYNGVFADDKQWTCYGLASPDTDQILLAYCKTGSLQAAAMEWIFSADKGMTRMTLEIRRVAGAEARQFEISKVVSVDWVTSAVPFDQGFK
ncbi:MAG: hypothetical protein V4819_12835 [Verrucomicrobiota bacterium]